MHPGDSENKRSGFCVSLHFVLCFLQRGLKSLFEHFELAKVSQHHSGLICTHPQGFRLGQRLNEHMLKIQLTKITLSPRMHRCAPAVFTPG